MAEGIYQHSYVVQKIRQLLVALTYRYTIFTPNFPFLSQKITEFDRWKSTSYQLPSHSLTASKSG